MSTAKTPDLGQPPTTSTIITHDLINISTSSSSSSSSSNPDLFPILSKDSYFSINALNSPVIGQKRLLRRNTSATSPVKPQSILNNDNCDLVSSTNNSVSTLNRNVTLNSSNPVSSSNTTNTPSVQSGSACKVVIPKTPKPHRTMAIFECVILGLNLSLSDLKTKVADLTTAVTNGYNAMAKQLLQSESYLRHLEQRISTLLKLQNSYVVHLKMKDGIQSMYEAYKKSPGNQKSNLANIKVSWKDCIQKLCAIEAQTEALLGTFQFQIEKLIGFARLCPGDTYELLIKYSPNSKFRTRTKIGKDNSQTWDSSNFSFKITIQDLLLIRINEIKFLGKNLLIGERICDTRDLFSTTQTQRLTLNANTSGTLKLSMLITWLPFENCEETFVYYNPTQYLTINSKENRLSSYTMTRLAANTNVAQISPNSGITLPMYDFTFSGSLQFRPTNSSLHIDSNYFQTTTHRHNVLTAITDHDDTDFDPSAASSSSTSTTSSTSNKKSTKISDEKIEQTQISEPNSESNPPTTSSSSSNIGELDRHQLSFCSSQSNLSQSVSNSHANTSHTSHEDFHVSADVEKCLDSMLIHLDIVTPNNNEVINLRKLADELFVKLQRKLETLRSQYIELNELYEHTQTFNLVLQRLFKSDYIVEEEEAYDDVMQYFDFLDEADDTTGDGLDEKSRAQSLKGIDVSQLPNDFDHFLIRHFSHCIQLIEDLEFISKSQANTSFRLTSFENVLFEKIQVEANILKTFLDDLIKLSNKFSPNSLITCILDNSLAQSIDGAQIWLDNLTDKCTLNVEKNTLITSLKKKFNISTESLIVDSLVNKAMYSISIVPKETDQQEDVASVSVYQFCQVYSFISVHKEAISVLDSVIENLKQRPNDWLDKVGTGVWIKQRVFVELVVSRLVEMCLRKEIEALKLTEGFVDKMCHESFFGDVLVSLSSETLFNLRNKSFGPQTYSVQTLKVLINLIKLYNKIQADRLNFDLIDESITEFLDLELAEFWDE